MNVAVLYFAAAREAAGTDRESLALPAGATVGSLAALLARRHPALASLASVRYAVDERFAQPDHGLSDGATVALLPPVSGG